MKSSCFGFFLVLAAAFSTASATTRYVDLNCPTPTSPYTDWSTAATNIQDAVDAVDGVDLILVTNGIYASGGRLVSGMSNRVAVTRSGVTLQSVNGPEETIIQGWQVPGTTNGPGAVRCVLLSGNVVLSGFTLTNGATLASQDGGGVSSTFGVVVTNCVITGNSARYGGGVWGYCTLNNCLVIGNSATNGGGVYGYCTVSNCLLSGNSAAVNGGGACAATSRSLALYNSKVTANSAQLGGGVYDVYAAGCVLTDNSADAGGGAWGGNLAECTVTHNLARLGAGISGSGAASSPVFYNCVIYFNRGGASPNYDSGTFYTCCTTPLPASGPGNISLDPQLASSSHLSAGSPCRGAGASTTLKADIDGEVWQRTPSMGCDEYNVGAVTGALSVAISAAYTSVAVGFGVEFASVIDGRTSASVWQLGDGTTVTNRPYVQYAWGAPGDYVVTLTAYNESHPEGVAASLTMHIQPGPVHFVLLGSTNPVAPYTNWATAAGDIQSAVDAASLPGAVVLAGDGVYATGGRAVDGQMTNRAVVDKPVTLKSVNGPAATSIVGYQVAGTTNGDGAIRCVYLAEGAGLSGFTLTNGATRRSGDLEREQKGGGVWCALMSGVISNCVLTRNSAFQRAGGAWNGTLQHCRLSDNSAQWGGGAYGSLLTGCVIAGNSANYNGGGVAFGGLNNCTVTGNSASTACGAHYGWLNNCIVYSNTTPGGKVDNYYLATPNFCCTTPLPSGGVGNFTNAPRFVDAAARDFHLQTNSPCINAGANGYVATATDLDGNPRIAGGTVDAGAYEFQSPLSVISYAWLQSYGLPMDGTADAIDSDSDGMNNWQEWIADTHPLLTTSSLRLLSPTANPPAVTLTWTSSTNRTYCVERAANSAGQLCFSSIASNIPGRVGTTSFTNANAPGAGSVFYRVAAQRP